MAYYDGIYICGHEGSVKIFGPLSDIEWKKERAFERLCPMAQKKIEKYIETEKHLMDGHGENSERDKISD